MFWKNIHLCFSLQSLAPLKQKQEEEEDNYTHKNPSSPRLIINNNNISSPNFSKPFTDTTTTTTTVSPYDSDADPETPPPDFKMAFASRRFFFSSPGRSNSIVESPDSTHDNDHQITEFVSRSNAIKKHVYSADPYNDFKCSMMEMIEARNIEEVEKDWEFLHELLFCYLSLNPNEAREYIISAFADVIVSLLLSSSLC